MREPLATDAEIDETLKILARLENLNFRVADIDEEELAEWLEDIEELAG